MKYLFALVLVLMMVQVESRRRSRQRADPEDQSHEQEPNEDRDKRLLPLFQIVTFPNEACASGTMNGTCYTAEECSTRGGTSSGSCANGFGICCTFTRSCGQMTNENCTYFTTPTTIPTDDACSLQVCPCGDHICQIRLDFDTFTITGPSTDSTTVAVTSNGNTVFTNPTTNTNGVLVSNRGQCLTDFFSATSPGNTNPPQVCGDLTGEHMYLDLNDGCCDELRFSLSNTANGASIANRAWNIKITQYSCKYNNLAPGGCTQYFFGSNTGQVMSFNFNNGHLADQNQNICVRRERGNCRICWVATGAADFQLSGPTAFVAPASDGTFCCGYGTDGLNTMGFDCIEIVGAMSSPINPAATDIPNSRFCGQGLGLGTVARTICSSSTPFGVRFRSDRYEFLNAAIAAQSEGASPQSGFRLAYTQDATSCTL